jgi:hypothetical protein
MGTTYVSQATYQAAQAQLSQLQTQIQAARQILDQDQQAIASLKNQIAQLQAKPHIVSYRYQYLSNTNSCLYHYEKIAVYSDGTEKDVGTVTRQEGICTSAPTVKYTYREYLSNTNSCYYHYAVIAVYTNGQKQQIGTVTVKEGKCA